MKSYGLALPYSHWRSYAVDTLIGASVLALAFAAAQAASGLDYFVPIAASILLVGIGWMVEAHLAARLDGAFHGWPPRRNPSAPGARLVRMSDEDLGSVDAAALVAMPPFMVR